MWDELPEDKKKEYKRMVLGYTALTPIFAQKASEATENYTPIVNSKFQETIFQRVFDATIEDIGNTSFDASLSYNQDGHEARCVVGIKTFGYGSHFQKVAQFKKQIESLSVHDDEIKRNSKDKTLSEINQINHDYYEDIAKKVSRLRNDRIDSSMAQIRGFSEDETEDGVSEPAESVYHVLMPAANDGDPQIMVGEIPYNKIDIDNIEIIGCSSNKTPLNFKFKDGNHIYNYTSADRQLLMDFNNQEIVKETWNVKYADNPYDTIGGISDSVYGREQPGPHEEDAGETPRVDVKPAIELWPYQSGVQSGNAAFARAANQHINASPRDFRAFAAYKSHKITESYSWSLLNEDGEVERYSGFNAFYGTAGKEGPQIRKNKFKVLCAEFSNVIDADIMNKISEKMEKFLVPVDSHAPKEEQKKNRANKESIRDEILKLAEETGNSDFSNRFDKILFRPMNELYIPIPNSEKFHKNHPDFFAKGAGEFKPGTHKLLHPKTCFKLVFEPSGQSIQCFITQDSGKGIESVSKQEYLGKWILQGVFGLNDKEPLTAQRLYEMQINGIRLYKTLSNDNVHLEFIWDGRFCPKKGTTPIKA